MTLNRRLLLGAALLAGAASAVPALRASDALRVAAIRHHDPAALSYALDQVIVQFRDGVEDRIPPLAIHEAGGGRARRSAFGGRYLVTLDAGFSLDHALARFRGMAEVAYAEPNRMARAFTSRPGYFSPNDRYYSLQWNLKMLDAERIWGIQKGDTSVVVAVLDTGVAYEDYGPFRKAPDFGATVFVPGFNAITGGSHANDDHFHGTHVASTIAEATDNNLGAAGLAFGCALMPVKVLDGEGNGSYFDIAEGVDYAVNFSQGGQKPVKVINLSLGGEESDRTLSDAINRAVAAGITVVAAAGNEEVGKVAFPASLDKVIAVGAVDGRKLRASYSNWGSALDLMAPGGDVDRDDTGPDGRPDGEPDGVLQQTFDPVEATVRQRYDDFGYWWVSGTSMAASHVSAVAALLYRQGITSPAAIKAALESTAEDLGTPGRDDFAGHGLIRPAVALGGLGLSK
ncbi:MAG TPA: S8 family serine peptidase [Vicinamibacteria bacterium]|nr:S8 family serine peptidase [Vicinamibacteria bacterium]